MRWVAIFEDDPAQDWVLEVDSRDEAVTLIEGDPYFRLGLRRSYRLNEWGKAPNYGAVTL